MGWDGQLLPSGYLLESGKAVAPLTRTFPGGGERGAPLAWSPAGLDTVGRMRSVVLPCRGRLVEGASERNLPPPPSFSLLSPNAQAESARCPRAVFSFLGGQPVKGLACMGTGLVRLVGGEGKET